jgi:hypothetical protein
MLLITFFTLWLAIEGRAVTLTAEYWDPARCQADVPALTRVVGTLLDADPSLTLLTGPDSTDACVRLEAPSGDAFTVTTATLGQLFPLHPHPPTPRSCPTVPRR